MTHDITNWVADCQECKRDKVIRQPPAPIQPIPLHNKHFSHIHFNFVGPLTVPKESFQYHFTIMDQSSK